MKRNFRSYGKQYMRLTLGLALGWLCTITAFAQAQTTFSPSNVLCIAPADPGGGWDFTCRSMATLLSDLELIPGQVRTQNIPGAGGAVAFANVVSRQAGDANVIVAASTATVTRLAQGQFQDFGVDDVRWAASLGADYGVIAVAPDSPYDTLPELLAAVAENPGDYAFVGGSAIGGWDHLKVLLAAQEAGMEDVRSVRYVSFSSGGQAIIEILAGRAQAFTGDVSEAIPQLEAGNLKVLAVLSEARIAGVLEDVATAQEQGLDVIAANWRGFYLPPGISEEAYDFWVDAFEQLYNSEDFSVLREANGLAPFWRGGADFEAFITEQTAAIAQLTAQILDE